MSKFSCRRRSLLISFKYVHNSTWQSKKNGRSRPPLGVGSSRNCSNLIAKYFRPPLLTMTKQQFNPEYRIPACDSSSSVSADYKITTKLNSRKVKYDKTNPLPQASMDYSPFARSVEGPLPISIDWITTLQNAQGGELQVGAEYIQPAKTWI